MIDFISSTDLIVFSCENFDSKDLRTPVLMKEFAPKKRVYFIESPIIGVTREATYFLKKGDHGVYIIQPYLPKETSIFDQKKATLDLLKELIQDENINHYTLWTDTPKAMHFIRHLNPATIIYDNQRGFSVTHPELEKELLEYADIVLTSDTVKPQQLAPFKFHLKSTDSQEQCV